MSRSILVTLAITCSSLADANAVSDVLRQLEGGDVVVPSPEPSPEEPPSPISTDGVTLFTLGGSLTVGGVAALAANPIALLFSYAGAVTRAGFTVVGLPHPSPHLDRAPTLDDVRAILADAWSRYSEESSPITEALVVSTYDALLAGHAAQASS